MGREERDEDRISEIGNRSREKNGEIWKVAGQEKRHGGMGKTWTKKGRHIHTELCCEYKEINYLDKIP